MEKTFTFYQSENEIDDSKLIEVKESDLTYEQIDHILGNFSFEFDKLPKKAQAKFASYLIDLTLRNDNFKLIYK